MKPVDRREMRVRRKGWILFLGGASMLLVLAVYHYSMERFGVSYWLYHRYTPFIIEGNVTSLKSGDIPENSIYFLETSGLPFLSLKQLCSIESAARYHPNKSVIVAIYSDHLILTPLVEVLQRHFDNIKFVHLDPIEWLNGTVLASWLERGLLSESSFKVSHTSDVLRYATLYKYGGIYLDLDIIIVRPLDDLKNALGLESTLANGAAMAFEKQHPFIADCMNETVHRFNGAEWGSNGPKLVSRVLNEWCATKTLKPMICNGVNVLPRTAFYPIPWPEWKKFFVEDLAESEAVMESTRGSYGVHMWNLHTAKVPITLCSRQPAARLAHFHCPFVSDYSGGKL